MLLRWEGVALGALARLLLEFDRRGIARSLVHIVRVPTHEGALELGVVSLL